MLDNGQEQTIEFTAPIWTALLAVVFLGERLNGLRVAAIALGFAGILVILRPGIEVVSFAALVVLVGSFGFATAYTFTKHLTGQDSTIAIPFYMSLIQLPIVVLAASPDWAWPTVDAAPWVLIVGAAGLSSHYCIARALKHADASVVMPLDFLRLPLIAVVGFLFYAEPLDPWVIGGAVVIFAGTFLLIRDGQRRAVGS